MFSTIKPSLFFAAVSPPVTRVQLTSGQTFDSDAPERKTDTIAGLYQKFSHFGFAPAPERSSDGDKVILSNRGQTLTITFEDLTKFKEDTRELLQQALHEAPNNIPEDKPGYVGRKDALAVKLDMMNIDVLTDEVYKMALQDSLTSDAQVRIGKANTWKHSSGDKTFITTEGDKRRRQALSPGPNDGKYLIRVTDNISQADLNAILRSWIESKSDERIREDLYKRLLLNINQLAHLGDWQLQVSRNKTSGELQYTLVPQDRLADHKLERILKGR